MPDALILSSCEVRWFFEGPVSEATALRHWFEDTAPLPGERPARLQWLEQPDIYLLLPGSEDMGIKWREGRLEIKGRLAGLGTRRFCGRHRGRVERWVKWSYADLPEAYRRLFQAGEPPSGLIRLPVSKRRARRRVRLGPDGQAVEVADPAPVDRGLGVELSDLSVGGRAYCSLAFEASPDDAGMAAAFDRMVELFLQELQEVSLDESDSRSYPAWLNACVYAGGEPA